MSKKKRIVRADTPEGQMAGEAILEAVKNQIRDNNPPETALTLARLLKNGESKENAMRLIACALSVELFAVMKNNEAFNEGRYEYTLRRLPELPFEESDEI
jgi:peroxiredoxin family protein